MLLVRVRDEFETNGWCGGQFCQPSSLVNGGSIVPVGRDSLPDRMRHETLDGKPRCTPRTEANFDLR